MPLQVWPAVLTNADWQKKKGAVAKIAGETGIGDALKAAQAAYEKIDFNKFDARMTLPQDRDTENMIAGKKACKDLYAKVVVPARAKVKEVCDLAEKTAIAWKKNKMMPASSTKAAEAVAAEADLMWMQLKDNSSGFVDLMKSWDDIIALNVKKADDEAKKLKVTIANLTKALTETAKTPTKECWEQGTTSAHQRCRSMCNTIRAVPGLKKQYWSTWQAFGDNYAKKVPVGGEEEKKAVLTLVRMVGAALKDFNANYEKFLS